MAYPPNMDKIKYYDDIFKKHGIVMALAAFHGEYGGKIYPQAYTDEEREARRAECVERAKKYRKALEEKKVIPYENFLQYCNAYAKAVKNLKRA